MMRKNYKDTFGANLKRAIRGSSFGTYEKFAEFMQVDRTTVSRWCIGQNLPKQEIIEKIAGALGTSYDSLFAEEAMPSQPDSSRIDELYREMQALKEQVNRPAQNITTLDPELQKLFERAAAIPRERRKAMMEGISDSIEACEEKLAREAQLANIKKNA